MIAHALTALTRDPVEGVEVDLLLEGMVRRWGYDLRDYDRDALARRLLGLLRVHGVGSLSALQGRALREAAWADAVLAAAAGARPRLFGDVPFWSAVRRRVIPYLRTYPHPRLWVVACGGGEELWSLAVLLHEEALADRCELYATDLRPAAVRAAAEGRIDTRRLRAAEARHRRTGARVPLAEHFEISGGEARLRPELRSRLVLATHSAATDDAFNEFQAVFCRGFLDRLGAPLRRRMTAVIERSLCTLGLVALDRNGGHEALLRCEPFVAEHGIHRRLA